MKKYINNKNLKKIQLVQKCIRAKVSPHAKVSAIANLTPTLYYMYILYFRFKKKKIRS